MSVVKITECPRDAMQGLSRFVPTHVKAAYINLLLQVGFDVIDFGSFVSPKAIPQLQDTAEVVKKLDLGSTRSKLLAIIANYRGAENAIQYDEITCLGFPLSISETFQQRNTNVSIGEAFDTVRKTKQLCDTKDKELRVYLSMGFGNPYGDEWSNELVLHWAQKLVNEGINSIALADTVGVATPAQISTLCPLLNNEFKAASIGIHLHSTPGTWKPKVEAAYLGGCRSFDTALRGYGGCPMAADELTGNIATENVITYLQAQNVDLALNMDKLQEAMTYSEHIFS